ncbi:MAG: hypothetical protein ACYCOR_13875 [Acidobacteriaceae bacterium]
MNHEGSSVLGKSAVILAIVAIVAVALNLAFAHSLHFESLSLLGFCLFSLRHVGNISSRSRRTTSKAEPDSSKATTQFRFAPVRDTHKGVLEGKGYSSRKSTFQLAEAVAQVAG